MPQNRADVLSYARKLADTLQSEQKGNKVRANLAAAEHFLTQYGGRDSAWSERATARQGSLLGMAGQAAAVLRSWADQVDAGMTEIAGARQLVEANIVSTDLMGQVRQLLEDNKVTPAAPIVLCGAALEIALRALADARSVVMPANPTLNTLTTSLRAANVLNPQDVKELNAIGGTRNQAAHGELATLSMQRAELMEQQANMMLRRIIELMP